MSRKYSRVNRFETPVIQGFEGWLMMTSKRSRRWVRKLRPSPTRAVTLGLSSGPVVDVVEEVRGPVDGRLELDHLQRRDGELGDEPAVTPEP